MLAHSHFEWDDAKAAANLAKHGVSFDTGAAMLMDERFDEFQIEDFDIRHSSTEERYFTIGSLPTDRSMILVVIWTPRGSATRIISARKAEAHERRIYEAKTIKNRP